MATSEFGPLYYSPMNRQLYYDDIRRHFGSQEADIARPQMGGANRFRPPSAGVSQDWSGDGPTYNSEWSKPTFLSAAYRFNRQRQEKKEADQQAYNQGVANWQGAYQQASQKAQAAQLGRQYVSAFQPKPPAPPNPYGQAYQAGMAQVASQPLQKAAQQMATTMSSPAPANPMQSAYTETQKGIQAQQYQALATQMANVMTTPYTPPERLTPPADSRIQRRAGQRTPGWK